MKILDRYILTSYLKTFFSVFIILVLIFVLQTIWLYIKELAGKDLDIDVIVKFLLYFMPKLMPLVVPLTILLTSIMVFGSFAENYEFAAMKSTGISLQRAMASLSVFIGILAIIMFFFSNNIIPWAEYNSYNLRKNIAKIKPAMAIVEGQFNAIENTPYNIKVAEKYGDRDQFLKDVVIHVKGANGKSNETIIVAKTGELVSSEASDVIKLVLFDGNYYQDIKAKKAKDRKKKPFAKSVFETYTINIDISNMNEVDVDDRSYSSKYSMLNMSELDYTIDSLSLSYDKVIEKFGKNLQQRSGFNKDSKKAKKTSIKIQSDSTKIVVKHKVQTKDSTVYTGNLLTLFNTKKKTELINSAINSSNSTSDFFKTKKDQLKPKKKWFNRHIIAYHEKLALGFACIILFFVGAPLGALIRKGGIGLPMVVAILLFLTYHFIGIFAVNSAKNDGFNPIFASWFSTLIMLPLGIYLTKRATADKGIVDLDGIIVPLKKILGIKKNGEERFKFLNTFSNEKLVSVINSYEALGYSENSRFEAIKILNSRGHSTSDIKNDIAINKAFIDTQKISNQYYEHSKYAITLYSIGVILLILHFVFKNNKLPHLASASIQLSIVSLVLFIIYYFKSILNVNSFYNDLKKKDKKPNLLVFILGIPLYFITYLVFRDKVNEDLKLSCLESLPQPKNITDNSTEVIDDISETTDKIVITKEAKTYLQDYTDHSKFTIILYTIGVVLFVLYFVFKNNKLPSLSEASIQLSITSLILYIVYYIKSILNIFDVYKHTNKNYLKPNVALFLVGFPLYVIPYILIKRKLYKDFK